MMNDNRDSYMAGRKREELSDAIRGIRERR